MINYTFFLHFSMSELTVNLIYILYGYNDQLYSYVMYNTRPNISMIDTTLSTEL